MDVASNPVIRHAISDNFDRRLTTPTISVQIAVEQTRVKSLCTSSSTLKITLPNRFHELD
jgi:hypothetical protein